MKLQHLQLGATGNHKSAAQVEIPPCRFLTQGQGFLRPYEPMILVRPEKISQHVAREVLELKEYDIEIHHLKGLANSRANVLSQRSDYDTGKKGNDHVTILPSELFIKLLIEAELTPTTQDEQMLLPWVNPHDLKKIDNTW
jgi:hypothetical protein